MPKTKLTHLASGGSNKKSKARIKFKMIHKNIDISQKNTFYRDQDNDVEFIGTVVRIRSTETVTINPGLPVSRAQAESAHPTNSCFWLEGLSRLLTDEEIGRTTFTGWNFKKFKDGDESYLGLSPQKQIKLTNDSLSFSIQGTFRLSGGQPTNSNTPLDTNLTMAYYNVKDLDSRFEPSFPVFLINGPNGKSLHSVLRASFAAGNPAQVESSTSRRINNSLKFFLSRIDKTHNVYAGIDTRIQVSFNYARDETIPTYWQMCTLNTARDSRYFNLAVDPQTPTGWQVEAHRNDKGSDPHWALKPKENQQIVEKGVKDEAVFDFTKVVCDTNPGITDLIICYAGIPPFEDGFFILKINKTPEVSISKFSASPSTIYGPGGQVNLSWTVERAGSVSLYIDEDDPISLGNVTSYNYSIDNDTKFKLVAFDQSHSEVKATSEITVRVIQPPIIRSFSVTPQMLSSLPGKVDASWDVFDSSEVTINGMIQASSGNLPFTVNADKMMIRLTAAAAMDLSKVIHSFVSVLGSVLHEEKIIDFAPYRDVGGVGSFADEWIFVSTDSEGNILNLSDPSNPSAHTDILGESAITVLHKLYDNAVITYSPTVGPVGFNVNNLKVTLSGAWSFYQYIFPYAMMCLAAANDKWICAKGTYDDRWDSGQTDRIDLFGLSHILMPKHIMSKQYGRVFSAVGSPDGRYLFVSFISLDWSSSGLEIFDLSDLANPTSTTISRGDLANLASMAITEDSKFLFAASDRSLQVFNMEDLSNFRRLSSTWTPYTNMQILLSKDNHSLYLGGKEYSPQQQILWPATLSLYNISKPAQPTLFQEMKIPRKSGSYYMSLVEVGGGRHIYASGENSLTVFARSLFSQGPAFPVGGVPTAFAMSSDGSRVAVVAANLKHLTVFDLSGTVIPSPTSISLSSAPAHAAILSDDRVVVVPANQNQLVITTPSPISIDLEFQPDFVATASMGLMAFAAGEGLLGIIDCEGARLQHRFELGTDATVKHIFISPGIDEIYVFLENGEQASALVLFEFKTDHCKFEKTKSIPLSFNITGITYVRNLNKFFIVDHANKILTLDLDDLDATPGELASPKLNSPADITAFPGDQWVLVTNSGNKEVLVLDISDGTSLKFVHAFEMGASLGDIVVDGHGRILVANLDDSNVTVLY